MRNLSRRSLSVLVASTIASVALLVNLGDRLVAAETVDFSNDVRPILARHCYACHGPTVQEAGLALDRLESAIAETESGSVAIVPGSWEKSELSVRVEEKDPDLRMPPAEHDPLDAESIEILKKWVEEGAAFNKHWAFEPLSNPELPEGKDSQTHPVDQFINQQLTERGLKSAPPADKPTLIRRLYFDLLGLPPTPEEVADFVADESADAYKNLVDRLLDSPHYGERWGRHWLDVVRYAETNSFERDGTKPNAWKYRDYVIRSFNDDKPYDQFLIEQLAGDEIENASRDAIIASGFYRLGIWDDEPADPELARFDELDSILTTIGQGMLGLTVNCARCHDHKIDPMPQTDYYQLLSFIDELTPYATRGDQNIFSQTDISTDELRRQYEAIDEKLKKLRAEMYDLEQKGVVKMDAEDQRATETRRRARVLKEKLKDYLDADQWVVYRGMKDREKKLVEEQRQLPERETVLSVRAIRENVAPTKVLLRGNPHVPGDEVTPAFPELFEKAAPSEFIQEGIREDRSGKRMTLAKWITSSDNLLTARVMVNRVWQHHFGRGIVRSSNNFGLLGTPPTHPELLNWLASHFMETGWSLKSLHRLILTSDAYQRSSTAVEGSLAVDPNNDSFWRFDLRRLSAEELRDATLAVTGELNLGMYGPSIYPELSSEVLATQSQPGKGWGNSSPEERNRRSIYIFIKRSLIPPELSTFDFPDTDVTCEARFNTIQPAQALAMVNGDFTNQQATAFAQRLNTEVNGDWNEKVRRGLSLVLSREPDSDEIQRGMDFILTLKQEHQVSDEDALRYFCMYALNLNAFVFVD